MNKELHRWQHHTTARNRRLPPAPVLLKFIIVQQQLSILAPLGFFLLTPILKELSYLLEKYAENVIGNLKSGQTCNFTLTHYSDSGPTSLCSYNLRHHAAENQKNNFIVFGQLFMKMGVFFCKQTALILDK
jgi:hypothetical protein